MQRSRRSIRLYKDDPVNRATLQQIIKMLPFIPTAKNTDDLYFSIIATKEKMDEIRRITTRR
ncbi:MAG: nitroreductase family protein [Desulfovibrio sp.]|nr:nitroreductase family protein [Desulfovibrio sp.]